MAPDPAILGAAVLAAGAMWARPVRNARGWRATITPLASIIGSGFLVLGPILLISFGACAPLVMAGLCLAAWLFGAAIRLNIAELAAGPDLRSRPEERLEAIASALLGFAYMISVAYYLNLFGAFGLSLIAADSPTGARLLTSAVFMLILVLGWTRGFRMLESLEYVSVSLKLAIIAGLLVGMALFLADRLAAGALILNPPRLSGTAALTLAFGLIVTVQGFETARYLGREYDARTRIRAMRRAQWISGAIYMAYILLLAYAFPAGAIVPDETAIIEMMEAVAPVLPLLLVAAALASQFSAAVADTGSSGGLLCELTRGRLSPRQVYALLTAVGLVLTWRADLFEIIAYASRAFAAYYAVQALIAALASRRRGRTGRGLAFLALALLGGAIALFGEAAAA